MKNMKEVMINRMHSYDLKNVKCFTDLAERLIGNINSNIAIDVTIGERGINDDVFKEYLHSHIKRPRVVFNDDFNEPCLTFGDFESKCFITSINLFHIKDINFKSEKHDNYEYYEIIFSSNDTPDYCFEFKFS